AGVLALAVTFPLAGTIWTRSSNIIKLPRGSHETLPNTSYATRDWSIALTSVEVRDDPAPSGGSCLPEWTFFYKNTHSPPHYVTMTVQCQDLQRKERARFSYNATLQGDHKEEFGLEIATKVKCDDWKQTIFVKVTVDFLSGPTG